MDGVCIARRFARATAHNNGEILACDLKENKWIESAVLAPLAQCYRGLETDFDPSATLISEPQPQSLNNLSALVYRGSLNI